MIKSLKDLLDKFSRFTNSLVYDGGICKRLTNVSKYSCKVGIDDFGAGYSNFHILSKLDISFVKIDGSLIKDIHNSKELEIIVRTIASIAKDFHIKTIAEFVATENIYEKVKALNIDYSQGYYFDKPLTFEEIV